MKSRIIPPLKQAVYYNLPENEPFISVLKESGAMLIPAGDNELNKTVSEILESKNTAFDSKDFRLHVPFLALSGFMGKELDALLEKLRLTDPARKILKAVVTPYNKGWTLEQLITEVTKEHEEFLKREQDPRI